MNGETNLDAPELFLAKMIVLFVSMFIVVTLIIYLDVQYVDKGAVYLYAIPIGYVVLTLFTVPYLYMQYADQYLRSIELKIYSLKCVREILQRELLRDNEGEQDEKGKEL